MVMYQRATITSADDIRATANGAGSHFFDAATMRFFNSRLLEGVYPLDGWESKEGARFIFITSERYEDEPRHYRVRMMTLTTQRDDRPAVEIDSDLFEEPHTTAQAARKAAKERVAMAVRIKELS